ncbi:MAG: adenosylcobalamin-dependent ribonucleoside-diphosphate reductase [Flavobacteriales bacterium]|nr:adenosylcobalamin-dependent ribonucleoside-diphosphate reductase [Flavobacteriales bacterium]MCW8912394.1 adenosylcobalamin-dependent ribonucleoside-diphosphate reductase [Flavobacteriales bacterium]MCW8936478.1 adenosylcobalamin-dependent ribonucleoside-diphosphate reductase [Flavobacteriales bacterium]MCW8940681.1 adenosylcobalamin-dependent ribonucleoside-diphosphate reductase [Flavobacteriales bacterium]MCW8967544.1 adenosylcobalamin-dependent ribonucleoside-diphosphate reductase [Flavob
MKTYSHEEALAEATKYFNGDELAANVWLNKYALKDSEGNIYESNPDQMHRRLAKEIARIENKYANPYTEEEIYDVLKGFKYIVPQGGPMTGIGNDFQIGSLSNCFVIGNEGNSDSYGGVMKIDEEQVQLMKRRGGVGHDLSHIRPKGSPVKNSALTSTGVVPFMERYSNSTREVAQDGRRGALMLSISIKHPDAQHFIDAKMDGTKVTGANVSVRIDDEFMRAVKSNSEYKQQYPIHSDNPLYTKTINAKEVWDKIIHNAWKSAEPGILFWDTVINESIPDSYADLGFRTVSTNPCGEIPLCPYDSCRLLAVNLYSYVENPFTEQAAFNYEKFNKHTQIAQRIMDDIVDLEIEKVNRIIEKIEADPETPEVKRTELNLWQKIKTKSIQGRRTGVGITAEGDMLAALGLKYGTKEATEFSTEVHKKFALSAYRASVDMAKDRGAFPIYDSIREEKNPMINRIKEADATLYNDMVKFGRRNIALLTIAPTGTTSLMTQTSSGIEPVFMVSYKRRRKVNPNDKKVKVDFVDEVGDSWEEFHVFHHKFVTWLEVNGYNADEVSKMEEEELNKIIAKSPYHGATANDVDWVEKVRLQGAVQKWIDHSISVTVNVPNDVPEDMVSQIYQTGWESGCKGITVYRDGSRSGVLISNDKKSEKEEIINQFLETNAPKRPEKLEAEIIQFNNENEKWIAVIGLLDGRPYEIFTGASRESFSILSQVKKGWVIKSKSEDGKTRYDFQYEDSHGYKTTIEGLSRTFNEEYWNYAKLISGVLRHGMPLSFVVDMVDNLHLSEETLNTWKKGVVRSLKKFIPDGTKPAENTCPSCNEPSLVYEEGCLNCKSCGHSKCG